MTLAQGSFKNKEPSRYPKCLETASLIFFSFFLSFCRWEHAGGHSPGGDRRIQAFRVDVSFCDLNTSAQSATPVVVSSSGEHAQVRRSQELWLVGVPL